MRKGEEGPESEWKRKGRRRGGESDKAKARLWGYELLRKAYCARRGVSSVAEGVAWKVSDGDQR